jgi:hypothetical protein
MTAALGLELGEGKGCLARIANLPPVPTRLWLLPEVARGEATHAPDVDIDAASLPRESLFDQLEIHPEDVQSVRLIERGVVEANMNARGKGLIEVADTISR